LPPGERLAGLDGLRVLAVFTIVLYHHDLVPIGWAGVQVFFVLSGYLITRLLWQSREQPIRGYLTGFYGRRALRIFPLYYGVLLALSVALAFTDKGAVFKLSLPYLATYTYNFWLSSNAALNSSYTGHFWSLSVEEQFYLLWPFVIYWCRTNALKRTLLTIVLLGPAIRLAEVFLLRSWPSANPLTNFGVYVLTPTYFDGFALGAYVALFPLGGMRKVFFASLAVVTGATWLALSTPDGLQDSSGMGPGYVLIWGYSLVNLSAALAIDCLVFRKLAHGFFDARPLQYLGKISYGLYVFHMPVQATLEHVLPASGLVIQLVLQIVITIAIADLSYRCWEKPFLSMKDRWFASGAAKQPVLVG
jgi:peptidoglycan/LPS O-acetylase OafA/YrhL